MSRQRDRMRSILGLTDEADAPSPAPAAPAPAPARHMPAGSIKALESTLTRAEREADDLRRAMETAGTVVDLDPAAVAASPIADRLEDDPDAFAALKASIAANGQEVPILVRPDPARPGCYQIAYGRRRLKAAADLGRPVRAVVRPLSEEELVLAQGIENSARKDLSWIEQATFALRLEERGHRQDVIARALTLDRTTVNKMIQTARAIPADLVRAIGRAPKIGRPRWEAFAAALAGADPARLRAAAAEPGFAALDAATRMARLLAAAGPAADPAPGPREIRTAAGAPVGSFARGARSGTLRIDDVVFAEWLADRLSRLYAEYREIAVIPAPRGQGYTPSRSDGTDGREE